MSTESLRKIWSDSQNEANVQRQMFSYLHLMNVSKDEREKLIWDIVDRVLQRVRQAVDGKDGRDGVDGKDGVDGHTPSKDELLKLITPLIPKVTNGKDGHTPTREELFELIKSALPEVKNGQDGKTPSKLELENIIRPMILEHINGLSKEVPQLTHDQILGVAEPIIRDLMKNYRKGWFGGGGGGDNVRAGTGVTITTNNIGAKVISVATTEVVGEEVSGSGTSWTLANTPTASTLKLYANGQRLKLTTDYSITGDAITTVNSWSATELLADYSY